LREGIAPDLELGGKINGFGGLSLPGWRYSGKVIEMEPLRMTGLVAAVVTPMDEKGELNLEVVPKIVDHLESQKITGIYIAGSTGEGMSLTDEERRAVAQAYVEAAKGRMKTFV
jgi:N-acetylneuraminate lyase